MRHGDAGQVDWVASTNTRGEVISGGRREPQAACSQHAVLGMISWFFRKTFWNLLGWVKMVLNRPLDIPIPTDTGRVIKPVPLSVAAPAIPIDTILVCHPDEIPPDERAPPKSRLYKFQVWLYKAFPPMQRGLPAVDADPQRALKSAFTRLHRSRYPAPELPPEFLGSPDLGSLAVRGPYACYLERESDEVYQWDLMKLGQYEHHDGLQKLGAKVLFKVDPVRRALRAFQIDTALGSAGPTDPTCELSKKSALCSATTHMSLVRHFNWVHLANAAPLAVATRNRLGASHPLCRFLWPYLYGTQQSNDIITRGQMVRGGEFESIFSLSFEGMCRLFEESHSEFPMVVNDPEQDARRRGIRQQGFDTPTQDNLEAIFDVLHTHARRYLQLYYPDALNHSGALLIRNDASVLAWLDELNSLTPNGVEVTRADVTFDSLARLIARYMYMATVQHELLGSFVWDYQLWTHRQPVRVYSNGQREPLDVYQRLVNANYNLNVHRRELIHDFSYLALDERARAAFAEFNRNLSALQASMEREPWAVWKMYPDVLKVNINA